MEAIQFIGTNPNELIKAISNAIVPELEQRLSKQFQPKEPTTYLTRKEVCELLHIDYSTLNRWANFDELTNTLRTQRGQIPVEKNKQSMNIRNKQDHITPFF
ncbi:hypothetical protein PG299_02620 [Riemerella anatipestifer]|nr:hypothetical protein [Riemerella anatipestifer]